MLMKLGKEKTVSLNQNFRLKYGTVDAKDLKAIYLQIESWVQPKNVENDYRRSVSYLKNVVFNSIYNNLDKSLFRDRFIVDLDLRTSGMVIDKRSFMNLEITLYLRDNLNFKSSVIQQQIRLLLNEVTSSLENNNFSFKPKKK